MSSHVEETDNHEEIYPSSDENHQIETPLIVVPSVEGLNDEVKSLREKLSAALLDANAKDELVQQHAKVAEEAIAGWEKADNEAAEFKQRLETAIQQNKTLENRVTHLDGALKECVRQLRQSREEQEQTIREAVLKNTQEWDSIKYELEAQILELQAQLDASKTDAPSVNSKIYHKLDYLEEENSALKFDILSQSEELEIMTIERDLSTQAAESASKQQLESIKKVARLEAECRKLRSMVNKSQSMNDYKSVAASSHYVESLTDSQSDSGERRTAQEVNTCEKSMLEKSGHGISSSDSWASALIAELDHFKNVKAVNKNPTGSTDEIDLMDDFLEMERLAGLPETVNGCCLTNSEAIADITKGEKASLGPGVKFTYQPTNEFVGRADEMGEEFVESEDKLDRNEVEYESEMTELERGELKCKLESFVAERGEIEYKLERMKVEWDEMKHKLERVEAERDEIEYKLERKEAAKCEIEIKLETIEAKRFEMEDQLEKMEAEKADIEDKLERMEAQKADMEDKIERMEAERAELEDKLERMEAQKAEVEDKVERLEAETAEHKERIQRMKEVTDELQEKLQRAEEGKASLKEELVTTEAEKTELLEKLESMEAGKSDMETVITIAHDHEQALQAQLMEAETKLKELQREMHMANELKRSFEDKFLVAELDAQTLSAKVDSLEGQLEKEQAFSAELEIKCQILEDELSRRTQELIHHQSAKGNCELKINQEDLAMAAGKLEECQQTIASLGNQLKSLATIENFLTDAAQAPQLSEGSIVPGAGGEIWKMHSNHTFLPKRAEGPQLTSPEATRPSFIGDDGLASPLLSSALSLNHVNNEKGKNGFVRLFSRSKGSCAELEN